MARCYIAARMRARYRCREYRDMLVADGHTVTSRWLDETHGRTYEEVAARDLEDVRRADTLVLVGHVGRNGGCATEFGVALERGMRIIHVAAERGDNVFTFSDAVEYHRHFADAVTALQRRRRAA